MSAETATPLVFTKHTKRGDKEHLAPEPLAPLFDTHAHLTCFWTKDPVDVLVRAGRAGVGRIVVPYDPIADHMTPATFRAQLQAWLAAAQERVVRVDASAQSVLPDVRYLVVVHPYGALEYVRTLIEALEDPRCLGVGEIGLDYHFDADDQIEAAPHDVQIACFERQLSLAIERNVPVELHIRNDAADAARTAHEDAHRILRTLGTPSAGCMLHCFTEDRPTMERFVELGCYIAFGGAATFRRNEGLREAFAACPLDRILFETDCPYMAPDPLRGVECEPAMIAFTVDALARDRAGRTGEDPVAVARAAWENARRLFARA